MIKNEVGKLLGGWPQRFPRKKWCWFPQYSIICIEGSYVLLCYCLQDVRVSIKIKVMIEVHLPSQQSIHVDAISTIFFDYNLKQFRLFGMSCITIYYQNIFFVFVKKKKCSAKYVNKFINSICHISDVVTCNKERIFQPRLVLSAQNTCTSGGIWRMHSNI